MFYNENSPMVIFSLSFDEIEFKNNIQNEFSYITKDFLMNIFKKNEITNVDDVILVDIKEHFNFPVILMFIPYEDNKIVCIPKNNIIHNQRKKNKVLEVNLREPMTSIFSMFPVLADNINNEKTEKAITNLESMQRQSYVLLKNINNISLANKLLMGDEFSLVSVDISSAIKSIIDSVNQVLTGVKINFQIQDNLIIKVSKNLITNGILALISNSIKFKKEKVEINIEIFEKNNRCVINYSDNSIGIKDEIISDVFNSYFSKDPYNEEELSFDTGVGLFILKTAVQTAKGNIFLTSEHSKGVKYSISIPIDNSMEDVFLSKASDFLFNRYSEVFIQLSEFCILPDL